MSKAQQTEEDIKKRIHKIGTFIASFSELKAVIKKIIKTDAKWETDICPQCNKLLERTTSLTGTPILECPECNDRFEIAERFLEELTKVDKVERGLDYPLCPKCKGRLKRLEIPYAECRECGKRYDAHTLAAKWFERCWLTPEFGKAIIHVATQEIIAKKERRGY
jgi:ribosomal protein L37AE/L43A